MTADMAAFGFSCFSLGFAVATALHNWLIRR